MKTTIVSMALATTLAVAAGTAGADSLRDQARTMFSAVPQYPPVIDGNELTEDKVELGRMLFFEPRLSASHLISCNTCHNVGMGGARLPADLHWSRLAKGTEERAHGV